MPTVSVIIPTYNRAAWVKEAVASIVGQTYPDWELIVVDDGSTDGTAERLKPLQDRLRLIRQVRQGVGAARNAGIRQARGEWIAFLDSDDLWHSTKLCAQMDFLKAHPDCRICQTEEIWIRHGRRVNPMTKHKKHGGWIFKHTLPRCIVSPSSVILHRSVLDEVGLFDTTFPACEDYDLWLRVTCRIPVELIEQSLITKRGGHKDQLSRTVPTLDRWRIRALVKILHSGFLSQEQTNWALAELRHKCRVYGNGCLKRKKHEEGQFFLNLAKAASENAPISNIEYQMDRRDILVPHFTDNAGLVSQRQIRLWRKNPAYPCFTRHPLG